MKLALIGFRGIPVIYSGFEAFAEKLSTELAKRDFQVTVYCRSPYVDRKRRQYKKVELVTLPTIKTKNLETLVHSLISTIHACFFRKYNVIYYLGVGNAIFCLLPKLLGIKTVINVDGFDWKREKWGFFAKLYLETSSYLSVLLPHVTITDSVFVQNYYKERLHKTIQCIPYGYYRDQNTGNGELVLLKKYGLQKKKYFVWVGRLVPENHLEELILAFKKVETSFKCLVVGDNLYDENGYKKRMRELSEDDKRIIFTGFLCRKEYSTVVRNAFAYIETKRSGGAHPSLIEAMGFGCFIISNDYPSTKEILGEEGSFYNFRHGEKDLLIKMQNAILPSFKSRRTYLKSSVLKRAFHYYNWEKIIERYAALFRGLVQS